MGQGVQRAGLAGVGTPGEGHFKAFVVGTLIDFGSAEHEGGLLAQAEDGVLNCMGFPMWAAPGMDVASGVVSVSVTPVYNAADFVCALSQRRMKFTRAIDLDCAVERRTLSTLKRSFYDEMAASCRCLDAALRRSGYTGSGSCVQPCLWCLSFRPTTHGAQEGRSGSLDAEVGERYGDAGATRDPGFQGDAAAWFVHGLQCRGLPSHHPVDERVIPVHNSLTLSRSWIS